MQTQLNARSRLGRAIAATLILSLAGGATALAASPPTAAAVTPPAGVAPVLVQKITPKDVPATEPVAEWNAKWNSYLAQAGSMAAAGPWLYVMSCPNGYLLQFRRDPATAKLQFVRGIEMHRHTERSWGSIYTRRAPDGGALFYSDYGTEQRPGESSLRWFHLDLASGDLALTDKREPAWSKLAGPYGYQAIIWNPGHARYYRAFVRDIVWSEFKPDGAPFQAGQMAPQIQTRFKDIRPRPSAIFSPEGAHYYLLIEKAEPAGDALWQVDQYNVDAASGKLTYGRSLDLPDIGVGEGARQRNAWVSFLAFSTDGLNVYLVSGLNAPAVMTLKRKATDGSLSVVGIDKNPNYEYLGGAYWERGQFVFNADGRGGYFTSRQLCAFTRDPATGALTVYPIGPRVAKGQGFLFFDPAAGNLYLGGPAITVYKTPVAAGE